MPARSYERLEDWASHQKTIGDDTARWEEQDAARRKRNAELMAEKNANVSASDGPVTINPDNYKVGSEGDRIDLARKEDEAQRRTGVQIDRRLSDTALADAYASRARQQEAIAYLTEAANQGSGEAILRMLPIVVAQGQTEDDLVALAHVLPTPALGHEVDRLSEIDADRFALKHVDRALLISTRKKFLSA